MDATNRKRKRDFQDADETNFLDRSFNVENCGFSAVISTKKRRKSLGVSDHKILRKVRLFIHLIGSAGARYLEFSFRDVNCQFWHLNSPLQHMFLS